MTTLPIIAYRGYIDTLPYAKVMVCGMPCLTSWAVQDLVPTLRRERVVYLVMGGWCAGDLV